MMDRFLKVICALVLIGSVLAFGGVHPITYSLAEIVLLFGVLLLVLKQSRSGRIHLALPVWPLLFALWVAIQTIPLPSWLAADLSPSRVSSFGRGSLPMSHVTWITLSINVHSTLVSLLKFLAFFSAFVLAAHLFDSRKKSSYVVRALVVLGSFEAAYGIFQYLTGWNKIFTYTNTFDAGNAFGTYVNRNDFAGLLEMVLPFVLAATFDSFEKRMLYPGANEGRLTSRGRGSVNFQALFCVFLLAILSVALVFSRSRGGILAAFISLVFIVSLGRIKFRQKDWIVLAVPFLTLVIGYAFWIGLGPVLARFEQLGSPNLLQTQMRSAIWKGTVGLIRQYPLTGTGLGTYGTAFRHYQITNVENYVDHAHNDYLEFAAETGWVGFVLLFVPIFSLLVSMTVSFLNDSHRYRRWIVLGCIGSTLALMIHSLVDFNLQIPANALVFATVLGVGYKAACIEPSENGETLPNGRLRRRFPFHA
jgi:O-antigen ligase